MSQVSRNCPYCNVPMKSEWGNIPRIRIPLIGSTEDYMPQLFKPYSTYTVYLCEQCGKVELFLNKPLQESIKIPPLKMLKSTKN